MNGELVPTWYVDVTLRRTPRLPGYGDWVFVERIIFDSDNFADCLKEAVRRIRGGIMEWHKNYYPLSREILINQAEECKRLQAESGHPDVWNLPEWRAKYILPADGKAE